MQIIRNDLNPCTVELKITCSSESVKSGVKKAYKELSKKVKIPGFRPGQAPVHLVQKVVSVEDVRRAAAQHIVKEIAEQALLKENLKAFERPQASIEKIDIEEMICDITLKVPLSPIVDLGEYRGLEAERPVSKVTDEDLEQMIQSVLERFGEREVITGRGALPDDFAVVDLKIKDSDKPKRFMIVIKKSFEDLSNALQGMSSGETKVCLLAFPVNIQDKEMAGKKIECEIHLESLSALVIPELTEEFVKGLNDPSLKSESLEEFKDKLRDQAKKAKDKFSEEVFCENLLMKLMELSTIHVPDTLWETVVDHRIKEISHVAQQNNVSIEVIIKQEAGHEDIDRFLKDLNADAKFQVERAIIAREIFTKENMQPNENDLTEALLEMCKDYGVDLKTLYQDLQRTNRLHEAQFRAIFNKVLQFLAENANVKEVEAKTE